MRSRRCIYPPSPVRERFSLPKLEALSKRRCTKRNKHNTLQIIDAKYSQSKMLPWPYLSIWTPVLPGLLRWRQSWTGTNDIVLLSQHDRGRPLLGAKRAVRRLVLVAYWIFFRCFASQDIQAMKVSKDPRKDLSYQAARMSFTSHGHD